MNTQSDDARLRYSAAEWAMRVELAACYRLADRFGFSDTVWGHITAKVPGSDHFLINRFGLRFDEVCASNLITVDLDGKIVDRGTAKSDEGINLTGFIIHSAVHAARADVHCVMHSHSSGGIAISALKDGLVPMTIDAMIFYGRTAYHEFEGLSVDVAERERMAKNLGDRNAMILRNHGLLTCGATVGETFMLMYYLERACTVQLQVLATGHEIDLPSDELCRRSATQSEQFPPGKYEWPALKRLVETSTPDYCE